MQPVFIYTFPNALPFLFPPSPPLSPFPLLLASSFALDWHVYPPVSADFLHEFGIVFRAACKSTDIRCAHTSTVLESAGWLVELSVCDTAFRAYDAPTVALSALLHELHAAGSMPLTFLKAFDKAVKRNSYVSASSEAVAECMAAFGDLLDDGKNLLHVMDKDKSERLCGVKGEPPRGSPNTVIHGPTKQQSLAQSQDADGMSLTSQSEESVGSTKSCDSTSCHSDSPPRKKRGGGFTIY